MIPLIKHYQTNRKKNQKLKIEIFNFNRSLKLLPFSNKFNLIGNSVINKNNKQRKVLLAKR